MWSSLFVCCGCAVYLICSFIMSCLVAVAWSSSLAFLLWFALLFRLVLCCCCACCCPACLSSVAIVLVLSSSLVCLLWFILVAQVCVLLVVACFLLLRSVFRLLRFILVAVVLVLSSLLVCLLWFAFCLLLWLYCLACLSVYCVSLSGCRCGLLSVCCCGLLCCSGLLSACSFVNKFMLFGFLSSSVFARFFRCCLEITLRFVYEPRFRVLGYRLFFYKNWSRLWLNFCGLCGHLLPFRLIKFLKGVGFLGYFGVLKNNWFVEN